MLRYLNTYDLFKRSLIVENFYLVNDKEKKVPLTSSIMDAITQKLGIKLKSDLKPVDASGAEGIVLSLDDYRVVKFFHSIQNAAKSIPLMSKSYDFTAKIFGAGKIILNDPVIYFRANSTYSKVEAKPTTVIYYLIMQRVRPDEITFNDVEMAYNKYMRLPNLRYDIVRELFKLDDDKLKKRLKGILGEFLMQNGKMEEGEDPVSVLEKMEKSQRNTLMNEGFAKWTKTKSKDYLLSDNEERPLILKRFLTNHIGRESSRDDLITCDYNIPQIFEFLSKTQSFNLKGKNGKSIIESYNEIKDLIKLIVVDNKIRWNDIHNGQFARNKEGKLIALDLGVKSDINAESYFNKNVSKVNLKGEGNAKMVESVNNMDKTPKRMNFYDFDGTLFQTEGKETGIPHWESIFGVKYPYIGWISKDESLALELDIKPVVPTLEMYKELSTPDSVNILLSDRLPKMKTAIEKNLDRYDIKMDYHLFNTGPHKVDRMKEFILQFNVYEINLFDNKISVIEEFKKFRELYNLWRPDMKVNIYFSTINNELIEVK